MFQRFHKQIDVAFDLGPEFFSKAVKIVVHTYGWSTEGTVDLDSACRYAYGKLRYDYPLQEITKLAYHYFEEEIIQAIKEAVIEVVLNNEIKQYCEEVLK